VKKRCIFLYVNQGFAVRYFLRSGILKALRKSPARVVILSPNAREESFRKAFESENVIVEPFEQEVCDAYLAGSKVQKALKQLRYFVLNGKYNTRTVDDFNSIFRAQRGWNGEAGWTGLLAGFLWETIRFALKRSHLLRRLLIRFECLFFAPSFHRRLFDKYQPSLVVTSSLGWWDYDQYLMREARHRGIKTVAVILSWDNTSGMGMAGCDADHIVAWSENMKRELIEYHDVAADRIFVAGVAHWDDYYDPSVVLNRDRWYDELGLDPAKRTIFFATKSPNRFPWAPDIVAKLAEGLMGGKIKQPAQLLVRLHPIHYKTANGKLLYDRILQAYEEVESRFSCVVLNRPAMASKQINFDLKDSETSLIASILKHSDVMLSMFSTMVIEAAIFDLPAINIAIRGGFRAADEMQSRQDIMIDYVQSHNQRVMKTGAVRTVFSIDELFDVVNLYLDEPGLDSENRARLKVAEAGPFPGKAGDVIARYLSRISLGERAMAADIGSDITPSG
jgi:hypothetical protein